MRKLLNVKDLSECLQCCPENVRNLIRQGKLNAIKLGRRGGFRVTEEDLELYIKNNYVKKTK